MDRKGDYGYDAPYALKAFAALGAASVVAAIVACWRQNGHLATMLGFYGAFFLGNAASFFYTTRRGKFRVWDESSTAFTFAATNACSTWAAGAAPC